MTKTFTQDDLIRYVYDEMSEHEATELEQALIVDNQLQDQYKELAAIKNRLDHSLKQPSDRIIKNILNYSESLNVSAKK